MTFTPETTIKYMYFQMVGACKVLQHCIPELIYQFPSDRLEKAKTHSITAFSNHMKHHIMQLYSYEYIEPHYYFCNNIAS